MNNLTASDPTSIGPYKVIERLGGGGMAEVFVVENPGLHGTFARRLALKRILPGFQSNDTFRRQFADEAKLAGRLHHPSIVSFLDSGEEDGIYYLVMELVVGTDLGRLMRHLRDERSRLPMSLAIYIAQRIAAALAYAHPSPHCVVHRDVSPQNILLGMYGEVKLADFGIARHAARDRTHSDHAKLKGKLPFMSPEQIAWPESIDGRSDLFSLGIVLFEMLTGKHPFLSDLPDDQWEEQAIIWRMMRGALAPRLLGVEPELSDLVARLLERDADRRPSTEEALRILQDLPQRRAPEELLSKYILTSLSRASSDVRAAAVETSASAPREFVEITETVHRGSREHALRDASAKVEPAAQTDQTRTVTIAPSDVTVADKTALQAIREISSDTGGRRQRLRSGRILAGVSALVIAGGVTAVLFSSSPQTPPTSHPTALSAPSSPATPVTALPPLAAEPHEAANGPGEALASVEEPRVVAADAATASPSSRAPSAPSPSPSAVVGESDAKRARSARLFVAVIPWGQVWVDGEAKGEAPVTLEDLAPGPHRIQVGQGQPQKTFRVRLSPGRNDFSYELEAAH